MQKSYLLWPYLKELHTEVTRSFKEEDAYYVELERTLFYPHLSGGQPEDHGTIDGIRVLHVREKDGCIQHQTEEEMPLGDVDISLDWKRRYDHMQQHTAQHILSGLFARMFSVQTVGFMIGETHSTVDFDALGRHNAEELVNTVCRLANRLIAAALPIHRSFSDKKDTVKGKGAPVRRIHIPTLDTTDCGGTHVANTAEVGFIRIVKTQKDRGHLRVTYLAGDRCMQEYLQLVERAGVWAERYNTGLIEGFARAEQRLSDLQALEEENKELRQRVTRSLREELKQEIRSFRGYKVLWRYLPIALKPSDLVPDTKVDLLFLLNREGSLYAKTEKPMQSVLLLMQELKSDPNFKGGGSATEWHGRFTEGPYDEIAKTYWSRMEALW